MFERISRIWCTVLLNCIINLSQFKHMMYDVMMSNKESPVMLALSMLRPHTLHHVDQLMSRWAADFHQNVKNVVTNLEKHQEKSFIIYYTDQWSDKKGSNKTLSFEYGCYVVVFSCRSLYTYAVLLYKWSDEFPVHPDYCLLFALSRLLSIQSVCEVPHQSVKRWESRYKGLWRKYG